MVLAWGYQTHEMTDAPRTPVVEALLQPINKIKIPTALVPKIAESVRVSLEVETPEELAALGSDTLVLIVESLDPKPENLVISIVKKWAEYFCGEAEPPTKNVALPPVRSKKTVKIPAGSGKHSESEDDGWDAFSVDRGSAYDPGSKVEPLSH